jgi:hypothetical protein
VLVTALLTSLLAVSVLAGGVAFARGGGGGGGGLAAPARLPADFPADVPLPPGTLQGSTGSAGQWTVVLLAAGSAADVERSAESLYVKAGFKRIRFAVLSRGSQQITIVAENRDHSATQTNLTIAVIDSKGGSTGAGFAATIVPGSARVSLARARRSGLQARFTAPAAARRATLRVYRTTGGRRRLLGSRAATVHAATNTLRLDAAAIRRRIRTGTYTLEVVLRRADGTHGPAVPAYVQVV